MVMRYKTGLVIGKFSPLHKGHEALIHFAKQQCQTAILISYSKPEFNYCETNYREQWLQSIFPELTQLVVSPIQAQQWYKEQRLSIDMPVNGSPDNDHRQFVCELCHHILNKEVDALFTSELYGAGFAAYLSQYFKKHNPSHKGVEHILFDLKRTQYPISGTIIRKNIVNNKKWLTPFVYKSLISKPKIHSF